MTDLMIEHGFVLTMVGPGVGIIEDGSVAIDDGKIVAVGKSGNIPQGVRRARRKINARGKAILPGLIDAHVHSHLSLFRGEAQDVPESEWMIRTVEPFEKHMREECAVKAARLHVVEGLKAGTTLFGDYGPFMESAAEKVYSKVGVRGNLASTISEIRSLEEGHGGKALYDFDPQAGERTLQGNLRLIDRWHGKADGRITCCLGPLAADMMSRELLLRVKEIAVERNLMMHFHLAQGARESAQIERRYGMSTVQFLDKMGFLCPSLMGVHCHGASDEELRLIAERGVRMISCPSAIAMIDGIVSPVWQYLEAGGYSAALGSDQACGNNNCSNMFKEMKMAALLNKVRNRDPTALPAWKVLRLVTIDAAKTLGLEKNVGSLESGKSADLVIVDLKTPQMIPILSSPVRNIVSNLVYSAMGNEVETVIVDGKIVMENRRILTIPEEKVLKEAQEAAEDLAKISADDYHAAGSLLSRRAREGFL